MSTITTKTIDAAKKKAGLLGFDVWVTEASGRGEGRLRVRASAKGTVSYWFRYSHAGKQYQLRIAEDTLALARDKARELSKLHRAGHTDLHGYFARQQAERERAQADADREAQRQASMGSFGQLLDYYVADLQRRGKRAHRDVANAFRVDVLEPFPLLAAKPAKAITGQDISELLRHARERPVATKGNGARAVAHEGKLATVAKLRRYLSAAFNYGIGFDLDHQRERSQVLFDLTVNPVTNVPMVEGADVANTWALNEDELRALLQAIEDLPERRKAIAQAMLYLAGQRVEMLTRVTWADLFDDSKHGRTMQLVDLKGGPKSTQRVHLLPVTDRLREVMAPLLALQGTGAPGPFCLTDVAASPGTLQRMFAELGDQLAKAGHRRFTWRNIRCSVETHMAALGIAKEHRAWLLSHGRTGVQDERYDRFSYLPEKRHDLDVWARYLDGLTAPAPANVVQLHA